MKNPLRMATLAAVLAAAGGMAAEEIRKPDPPPAELKKIERFVGTWKGKGELKASPLGPGGTMTWTETCDWFEGKYHIICHSQGTGPAGEMKGLSIMGYDPATNVYTLYGMDNGVWSDFSTGTLSGKTWTFTSRNNSRFTMTEESDTKNTFVWQMSPDGKDWTTMMTGETTR